MKSNLPMAVLCTCSATALTGQLPYPAVTPGFGGSVLNGGCVIGLATADNAKFRQHPETPSTALQSQISPSLLSSIAFTVSPEIVGPNVKAAAGTFDTNDKIIQFK
jgi:hypothetical protein